jgi:hypothetical protein
LRSLDQNVVTWHNEWNRISINQAHILHFHGSRGSQEVINIMREISDQLGIKL